MDGQLRGSTIGPSRERDKTPVETELGSLAEEMMRLESTVKAFDSKLAGVRLQKGRACEAEGQKGQITPPGQMSPLRSLICILTNRLRHAATDLAYILDEIEV